MRNRARASLAALPLLLAASTLRGQVTGTTDVNVSKMANYQNECSIAKDPTNKLRLFASCNNATGGLFAARSTDGGVTWIYPDADKTIADGDAGQGPLACCDPALAWDTFGNLFITYLGNSNTVETILSTDGGATFSNVATFSGSVDQPSVAAAAGEVWVVWNQSGSMRARGAAVTGLGAVGAFGTTLSIPGTTNCSFGDVAISPGGAVVQVCEVLTANGQDPTTIRVNTKADGLGPNPFNAGSVATNTNVGGFDAIPAQNLRTIDAEAGLAYDFNPASAHFRRLYLVYTDESPDESNDTNVLVRFSDDDGGTWSAPVSVSTGADVSARSQFLPRIASNPLSGNITVCWHDARNSGTNSAMQEFCSMATPTGASPTFFANAQISDGSSTGTGSSPPVSGQADIQFGDYSGLAYFQGFAHPIWADDSNSAGGAPDPTKWEAYTDRVNGGVAANEGDPHITTVDGIHYDFQSAGEFTVLRDAGGTEIQTRQTPIPTASVVGNSYTGLTTCVSLNTAVAARVGKHRVTFQPEPGGAPDPSGLKLRVDGTVTALPAGGVDLGPGARVVPAPGGGIQVEFPDETMMFAVPAWWSSQSLWYLNVDVYRSSALEGVMGARAPGSWLPALSDGTSLGAKPAALHQRFVDLYDKFAGSWRVTDKTSLFDYAPGSSTAAFTIAGWPPENPPCVLPNTTPVKPLSLAAAREACVRVTGRNRKEDCVFDVQVTGETGFAKAYLLSQKIQAGATAVSLSDEKNPSRPEEAVTFTATVSRIAAGPRGQGAGRPAGVVRFFVDGERAARDLKLDARGQARWRTAGLKPGKHRVSAAFLPGKGSALLPSSSADEAHVVGETR